MRERGNIYWPCAEKSNVLSISTVLFLELFIFFEEMRKLLLEEVRGHMSLWVLFENILETNAKLNYSSNSRENIMSWQAEFTLLYLNKKI